MPSKRLLALIMAFVLLFSIAGCTKKPGNTGDQSSPSADPSASPTEYIDILSTVTPAPQKMKPIADDSGDQAETAKTVENLLTESQSTMEKLSSPADSLWTTFGKGKFELAPGNGVDDSDALLFNTDFGAEGNENWNSPSLNLANIIKEAGEYQISFRVRLDGEDVDAINGNGFAILVRGSGAADENSFIVASTTNSNYRMVPAATIDGEVGDWMTVEFPLTVLKDDIDGKKHNWLLCLHTISEYVQQIYLDDVVVGKVTTEVAPETQKLITSAETWVANEMTFISAKNVKDPIMTTTFDVIFKKDKSEMKVPGFWDGDNVWRVRVAFPAQGTWSFTTVCSDTTDTGLHGISGTVNVTPYSGDLDIYKHGFVKVDTTKKCFVYADGTPFFYLGDTHWNFLTEEFDKAGNNAAGIDTTSHFKYIVNKRVAQGFTVYQSEPIGASFDLSNGIGAGDIAGFKHADKYFKYIADQGLVHANAQFFFSSTMYQAVMKMDNYEEYLDVISRYWVARYGAYPVMWTLAQEIDNDFYYMENQKTNTTMNAANNPWKNVCEFLHKYDPHKNPITGHQEGSYSLMNFTTASNSSFRDVEGHSWWATQWKPKLDQALDFSGAVDFWNNGQNKPAIMYEGRYDKLWTNEYGARAQGYLSFLNGMFGHGYGATDIWLYRSDYDMEGDTTRDGITVTLAEKSMPWGETIELASGYQMGYMKEFFERYEWWKLQPFFGDTKKFASETGTYSVASIGTELYIAYFYDPINKEGTTLTGTLKCLDASAEYTYQWYNPRTNVLGNAHPVEKANGTEFVIGQRPSAEDWVLVVQIAK